MFNEFLFHEKVILDPLEFKLPEATLGDGSDSWKFCGGVDAFVFFLPAYAGRRRHGFFLGLLVAVVLVLLVFVNLISHIQKYFKFIRFWLKQIGYQE